VLALDISLKALLRERDVRVAHDSLLDSLENMRAGLEGRKPPGDALLDWLKTT
jgi:hypothetical protein